jgi:hypothetical protein
MLALMGFSEGTYIKYEYMHTCMHADVGNIPTAVDREGKRDGDEVGKGCQLSCTLWQVGG